METRLSQVWLDSSVGLEAQAAARRRCLEEGVIGNQWHYVTPHQASLWQRVHEAHSPAHRDEDVRRTYAAFFEEVAAQLPAGARVVSLGSGGALKDRILLRAMIDAGRPPVSFLPLDVSPQLALLSAKTVADLGLKQVRPVIGDLLAMSPLSTWLRETGQDSGPRVLLLFGLLPNFEPEEIFPWLSSSLGNDDVALVSANLAPVSSEEDALAGSEADQAFLRSLQQILPQYDNSATFCWLWRVIEDWGWADAVNRKAYEMILEEVPVSDEEVDQARTRFVARVPWNPGIEIAMDGRRKVPDATRRLRLFFSYRYSPRRLQKELATYQLVMDHGKISASREEGIWRVRRMEA